jgi:penicillin amidase
MISPMPARPGLRSLLRALGRRQPTTRGSLQVDGLQAPVTIARDRWGIPHVEAATDADAWFALGFCHGQDRGFQLELLARAGRGTLSELLGPPTVPLDRLSRTLGFHRTATAQLGMLDGEVRRTLDAYAAGVNAAARTTPRPHELALLRAQRSAWTAVDVLAFLGLQALALSGNWDTEMARLQILLADGAEALLAVDPTYGPWLPTPVGAAAGAPIGRLAADLARLRDLVAGPGASNAWAVAGPRTRSGTPILANDPHLAPSIPAPWYLAHLRTPDWEVAGASYVGGPAFPTGHNGQIAWGITAGCTDSADLFWEELDEGGAAARGPAGPEPVERLAEPIAVRGGPTVHETVLVTARGPIVTPLLDGPTIALSLRATWLEPAPVRGFIGVHRARDFATFREAFRAWPGPALNVVYADVDGHVGWQLIGTLPRRRAGNGTVPLPAWDSDNAWEDDHLPFEELPFVVDPPAGFVASANNAARSDATDQPFLGIDWLDGYRAARIAEALDARDDWDVASTAELQRDLVAVAWRELSPFVLAAEPTDPDARLGAALLRSWDGLVSAGSAAASVYELLVIELAGAVAREAAPTAWRWALGAGLGETMPRTTFGVRITSQLVGRLRDGTDRRPAIEAALAWVVRALRDRAGDEPAAWQWGRLRRLRLLHPLGAQRPLDRLLNVGPVPLGGDANTVSQAAVRPLDPFGDPGAIPNHRTVIDLGDLDASTYILAGGQSGNPLSPHYADLFELWRRGDGVPIAWSPDAVATATVEVLELRPSPVTRSI